jgi:predicted nucleic acid-binding protein
VIVVDTNVLAYLLVPGPFTPRSEALFRRDPAWAAPTLWRSELRNVLVNLMKASRASLAAALAAMEHAEALMTEQTIEVSTPNVLGLASRSGCSAYDCEFVALAMEMDVPLVTCDRKLAKAFPIVARLLTETVEGEP